MIRNETYRFSNLGEQDDRQVPDQYTLWSPPPLVIIVKNEKWEYSSFTFKTLFSLSLSFENDYDPNFQNERKVFLWEFIDNEPWDTHKVYEKDVWRHRAPLCQNAISQIIRELALLAGMQFSNDQLSYKKTLLCCRCPTKIEYS